MRSLAIIFLLLTPALNGFAQKPNSKPARPAAVEPKADENGEFQKARYQPVITERIAALKKFVEDFPASDKKTFALELISSSRAELGDQKLRLSDVAAGVELFKLAVAEAPTPVSDKLYTQILINLPTNLLYRGQNAAAFEVARMIEEKVAGNAPQLLGLASFYLGSEAAAEAKRLAAKVIELEPELPAAYQTLGLANRIDFDPEAAAEAYTKALELDAASAVSKRSLAEMKRAVGKPAEAAALYREVLEKDPTDGAAETGLILSLFDADKRAEAETLLRASLEKNPENLFLLVGAAYWYAAHNESARTVELAGLAVAYEPRYTWAHIALARGLMQQKKPLEAERTLLIARQYGNFPTLDYELAAARLAAGFYREAADELKKSFSIKDGLISTKLGGRRAQESRSFTELLAPERRASIFEPLAADNPETAEKLRALLKFTQTLEEADELRISEAVDDFVRGDDNMKMHRQLYAAGRLLEKRTAVAKALELTGAAVGDVNPALDVAVPAAAVMADELYESRVLASTRDEVLIVPEVPRPTLAKILRGRIEELTGWALFQQEKPDEAVTRLKRAISVLPENSAWWRSSQWRLGDALDAAGKPKEALDAYLAGYGNQRPDPVKRIVIESVYQKVNGSLDGLDRLIGAGAVQNTPVPPVVSETAVAAAGPTPEPPPPARPTPTPTPANSARIPENVPFLKAGITPENPVPTPTPEPPVSRETLQIPENVPTVEPSPTPSPAEPPAAAPEKTVNTEKTENTQNTENTEIAPSPTPDPNAVAQNPSGTAVEPAAADLKDPEKTENKENTETKVQPNPPLPKSLFEPIIISVPGIKRPNPNPPVKTAEAVKPDEKPAVENNPDETKPSEAKPVEPAPADENPPESTADSSATTRPRVVQESKSETVPCRLSISQTEISLINDGGSLGMFVGYEGTGDLAKLKAKASSSKDISVLPQPDVGVLSERVFYIIKSISPNVGTYTVTFSSPCGKKELTVTVR